MKKITKEEMLANNHKEISDAFCRVFFAVLVCLLFVCINAEAIILYVIIICAVFYFLSVLRANMRFAKLVENNIDKIRILQCGVYKKEIDNRSDSPTYCITLWNGSSFMYDIVDRKSFDKIKENQSFYAVIRYDGKKWVTVSYYNGNDYELSDEVMPYYMGFADPGEMEKVMTDMKKIARQQEEYNEIRIIEEGIKKTKISEDSIKFNFKKALIVFAFLVIAICIIKYVINV